MRDPGPDVDQLSATRAGGLRTLMAAMAAPDGWSDDMKASTLILIIRQLIEEMRNPRWKAAARAAVRVPAASFDGAEYNSLTSRFRAVAEREGLTGDEARARAEAYRGYWMSAAKDIADALGRELARLRADPMGWSTYRVGAPSSPTSPYTVAIDRTDVLYQFDGRRGVSSINYRWLTALEPIDHYDTVGRYFADPDAPVEIVPLANCRRTDPPLDLPEGGKLARLRFGRELQPGEQYFFAYVTHFNSDKPCRPTIAYECRGRAMRHLVIRAQFDPADVPSLVWWFDLALHAGDAGQPGEGEPQVLAVGSNGYIEHTFTDCGPGRRYGLRWVW